MIHRDAKDEVPADGSIHVLAFNFQFAYGYQSPKPRDHLTWCTARWASAWCCPWHPERLVGIRGNSPCRVWFTGIRDLGSGVQGRGFRILSSKVGLSALEGRPARPSNAFCSANVRVKIQHQDHKTGSKGDPTNAAQVSEKPKALS